MKMKNRNFITLMDFNRAELEGLLELATEMKAGRNNEEHLKNKYIGMLFTVASTRTRISFQVAAHQLGGQAEFYNSSDLQMINQESLVDTASVMGRFLDALIVRLYDMDLYGQGREALMTIAKYAQIPVINALDDKDHPCQVMADLLTLKEKYGADYKKKKIVMAWGYSKRQKSPGVLHSMLVAASLLGMNVTFAHPKGYELDTEYLSFARSASSRSNAKIEFSNDLNEAAQGADVIYVKNWKSLQLSREQDDLLRNEVQHDWCISEDHYKHANPEAYYMDCMPFIRGEQVTAAVADGPRSIIYDQAENRLHMQKAIMTSIIGT
jgi:ornithine carbamoyltransferase